MKQKLQEKLFNKYPKIFRQKDLPMTQTAMCWGIECGDGWYDLIDNLCYKLQGICDIFNNNIQVEATQVKEKYGTLRFYYTVIFNKKKFSKKESETVNLLLDIIDDLVEYANNKSEIICEICGEYGEIININNYIQCLCKKCKNKKKENNYYAN